MAKVADLVEAMRRNPKDVSFPDLLKAKPCQVKQVLQAIERVHEEDVHEE